MIPFDRAPGEVPPEAAEHRLPFALAGVPAAIGDARHATLPPPQWTTDGRSKTTVLPEPLPRRVDICAEQAHLEARIRRARALSDDAGLRVACTALARWLASRDRDLDEAVALAEMALSLGEDGELRREMAAWLETLGEPARAAQALKPIASMSDVESQEASYVLVRTGILKARAGTAAGAAAAFEAAMSIDPSDALAAELLGSLSAWQGDAISGEDAATAYVEAARRRAAAHDDHAELEDLWRAFRLAPGNKTVVDALAEALEARGRSATASEVRRVHARSISSRVSEELEDSAVLALAFGDLTDDTSAVRRGQRLVALRPGDRQAILDLLDRLLVERDPWGLSDTLAWLLSQPQPALWLAEPFARALRVLTGIDPDRGAVVARRALDVLGPLNDGLRETLLEVATRASDDAFAAAVLERWLSCGAPGADRREIYASLAGLRERLGDEESETRIVARAVREGLSSSTIDGHLERLVDRPATPDAQLWRARAVAERLSGDRAAAAWRDLGGALWDMADDREGAIDAWLRGARAAGESGYLVLAVDLVAFAGTDAAFNRLEELVHRERDDVAAGSMAVGASRAALSVGRPRVAFEFAALAIARRPARPDALELAERAAGEIGELARLSELYQRVGAHALGRFGRRAVHYRAARFFERRDQYPLALHHAARAFDAVPSEGSSFHLLARTAERAGDPAQAIDAVTLVAERADQPEGRTVWLLRAASIAGEGEEGARRRVDVLLQAAVCSPSVTAIAGLRDAAHTLLGFGSEERVALEIRLRRAAGTVTTRVSGPEGARISIAFALMVLDLFSDADEAMTFVERAFACDGDVDEYADLATKGADLAAANNVADRVANVLKNGESAHANIGVVALRLLSSIAAAVGDDALRARIAVALALRQPDDNAAVVEGDAAVRAVPALEEAFSKRVSKARRSEALIAAARARVAEGAHADAAMLFERALDLVDDGERKAIERELRLVWEAAGRSVDIEARVQRDAASEGASPVARADHWGEIASRREARGDLSGAVRALTESCKLDPEPLERWSALERIAELANDDECRVLALEGIALRVGARGRVAVFKRLARAHERRLDADAVERAWLRVLTLDPNDEEADQAVESAIVERGRYDELVDHLARRADRLSGQTEKKEMLRALRLRRAAILEQRLGRMEDACDELALLLEEWPDSPGALRYLADLFERSGQHARAASLWCRAAALETDPLGRDELGLRAGRAFLAAGDAASAMEQVQRAHAPTSRPALELRIEIARVLGADEDLGLTLEALAAGEDIDDVTRSDLLLEAAQAAARAGDPHGAQDRAARAAAVSPERATPQLLARALEYRLRGAGAPDEARRTIDELDRIREPIDGPDAALRAFLIAEALDVLQGRGAALRELDAARAELGDHPLLGLGLAERYAAMGQSSAAVDEYRIALRGSLLDMRRSGSVALHAAEAAVRAGRERDAAHFLDLAETDPETRAQAQGMRAKLLESVGVVGVGSATVSPGSEIQLAEMEAAVRSASTPFARAHARLALGRARIEFGDASGAEPLLWEALADGLAEAGDALAPLLSSAPDRGRDVVRLRRQQVSIEPGDVGRLELLRAAALADDDRVYGRAVEHVLRAFDPGAGPLPAPSLATQPEQAGIFALLTRPSRDSAGEALGALWDGASHLFARDAATYGIAELERIVPGPTSAVAHLYEVALRLFDIPRTPLYVAAPPSGPVVFRVAVLSPPSVLLTGDVREESVALRFALGQGLAAALPQDVMRLGVSESEGAALVDAIRAAFGPPEIGRRVDARAARLAQSFWQTVPTRTQRRLQELLGSGKFPDYDELLARARQSGRRVGMFLAGDFAWAARHLVAESTGTEAPLSLQTLRPMCEQLPMLADLLRLAVSPEYAAARWHVVAPAPQRGMLPSSRFGPF